MFKICENGCTEHSSFGTYELLHDDDVMLKCSILRCCLFEMMMISKVIRYTLSYPCKDDECIEICSGLRL